MDKLKSDIIQEIKDLVHNAAKAAITIYNRNFETNYKHDNSPVTEADLEVNRLITEGLAKITPEIPVISEETSTPYEVRKEYERYWLLDPIDGTKEFVNRNGEFTINLGLVDNGIPCLGFIYVPVTNQMYYGGTADPYYPNESQRLFYNDPPNRVLYKRSQSPVPFLRLNARGRPLVVEETGEKAIVLACSRSHRSPRDERLILNLAQHYFVNTFYSGSTIKVCRIAEGSADAYVRFQGLYDWDLAAAHAIAIAAGADVFDEDGRPVVYNTPEQRIKPFAVTAPSVPKDKLLHYLE